MKPSEKIKQRAFQIYQNQPISMLEPVNYHAHHHVIREKTMAECECQAIMEYLDEKNN